MSRRQKLLNFSEALTDARLREVCEPNGCRVFAKVRIADVLPISGSGICDEMYAFALKAHFDFVVVNDEVESILAVEFDGPSHDEVEQQRRDDLKNQLCDHFSFPLLRVTHRYLESKYRNLDLLSWFIETWFARKQFTDAQESGDVPWDEPFVPSMFIALPHREQAFPLWLGKDVQVKMQRLFEAGRLADFAPSTMCGRDQKGNLRAIAFVRLDERRAVMASTGMRAQRFDLYISELVEDLALFELDEILDETLIGSRTAPSIETVHREVAEFKSRYNMIGGSWMDWSLRRQ